MSIETAIGITSKAAIGGAIGSAIGTVLGTGTWWERILRGLVGAGAAYVGHHPTAMIMTGLLDTILDPPHLPTWSEMEPIAAFGIGIVGMVACQAAVNAMTAVRDKADDYVEHKMDAD